MTEELSRNLGDEWQTAKKYSGLYGNMPGAFTTLIRSLGNDYEKSSKEFSAASRFQLLRILKSDSFKSPFYFALKTFKPAQLDSLQSHNPSNLITLLTPIETAAILATLYLYRRARKLCDQAEWRFLTEGIHMRAEVSGLVGSAIPAIGLSVGLLAECRPILSWAAFLLNDLKGFQEYRRGLKLKKNRRDFEFELRRWGCVHLQVGAHLLLGMGLGGSFVSDLMFGLEADELGQAGPNKIVYATKLVTLWTDALLQTGREPQMKHDAAFYPEKNPLAALIELARLVKNSESQFFWLEKNKHDIGPDKTPRLFLGSKELPPDSQQTADSQAEAAEVLDTEEILE